MTYAKAVIYLDLIIKINHWQFTTTLVYSSLPVQTVTRGKIVLRK